ncbi:GH92 family glycosyl hydrolase [Solirubrobacter soli]|uniref:GH92 family glycosyl hydrolase n=1 Tax=Solirubrobacter soli TaxID=363832 RepID=UPI00042483CE|nr:GH92 family glycosyl hydrolase [Solirubrobacter soli]
MIKKLLLVALAAGAMTPAVARAAVDDPAGLVDPLIGTANGGNVFPGADTPFGMVQFSPDETNGNQAANVNSSGYSDGVNRIRGFGLAHVSGAGCGGLAGDVPFFPYTGDVTTSPTADVKDATYSARFTTANQHAKAGAYDVTMDNGVKAELSATTRTAAGRFSYPASGQKTMLVRTSAGLVGSSDANVTVDPDTRTISGSVTSGNFCGNKNLDGNPDRTSYYTLYFVAKFDADFTAYGTWKDATVAAGAKTASGGSSYDGGSSGGVSTAGGNPTPGKGSGAYVQFANQQVGVRVGVSYVDAAGAQANLDAEQPAGTSFDKVAQDAHDAWNTRLKQIEIDGGTAAQQKIFYTALYHSLLHMNVFSDVDGRYRGMDQKIHTIEPGQGAQYATFSGWDVYRSQVQLVSFLDPAVAADMAQSLYNQAKQDVNGRWDRWTHNSGAVSVMSGDPSPAFVDTVLAFGGSNFDKQGALQSLVTAATVPTAEDLSHIGWMNTAKGQRPSLDQFLKLGYYPNPSNAWSGASETLENSTADFAIADLAQRLGDLPTHTTFMTRAQSWQNIWHNGFMQNRSADGTWPGLDPSGGSDFAEGSPTQYVWNVPFNVAGLFAAMGGPQAAASRLDAYFHNGANWAFTGAGGLHPELNNEPSMWAPWLFAWSGEPAKTQQVVRQVMDTLWTTTTRGIPGNDDLGTMSSWYVFSALGMYPMIPGRAEMVLGSPLFTKAVVHRRSGQTLTITGSGTGPYVASATLDGTAQDKPWLPESFVAGDHTLDFTLSTTATDWGKNAAAPPSFRAGEQPAIASLASQSFQLDPGGKATTALTIQNTTDAPLTVALHPNAAHVTVNGGPFTVPAGGKTTADVTISAPADTPLGTTEFVDLGLDGAPKVVAKVAVDQPKPLAALFNSVGSVNDQHAAGPAFDSTGHSFSRQALAAVGITGGAKVSIGGFDYTWPDVAAGSPDNYLADGTRIALGDVVGATRIGLLGSAANGPSKTTATVTYSDGSTSLSPVQFGDWTLGGGGSQPSAGNRRAATTDRRTTSTSTENVKAYLFSAAVPLTPGKTAVSVSVPAAATGFIHVFALALDKRGPQPLEALRDQAGIARDAFHAEASLDWTGHAFSKEALALVGATPGAKLTADGLTYSWPDVAPGNDNVEIAGQQIALPPYVGATKIGLLATAIKGPADTVATVAYTDGTVADTPLSISDWTPGSTQAGNTKVFETTYRATTAGTDTTHAAMYSIAVPVAAGKRAAWIRLSSPTSGNAAIHLFAVALDGAAVTETSAGGAVGGTVPATLALTLGPAASFGAFTPGVTKDYTATTSAQVTSTAGDAALTVSEPGHLTNGAFALADPLRVEIAPASWTGPVTAADVALTFKQHVDAGEPLRTGAYAITLTFTLSTSTP